jgi:hypothetical protein
MIVSGFWPTTHSGTPGGTFYVNNVNFCHRDVVGGGAVTYEELTPEHKQKFDEIKALFEADLIRSFERTHHDGIRWKGFSLEGAIDGMNLFLPSEECTRSLL